AIADAGLGTDPGRSDAVQVDIRLSNRGVDRPALQRRPSGRVGGAGDLDRNRCDSPAHRVAQGSQALFGGKWMRSLGLIWTFLRVNALNELQYRANLVVQVF